ncbi:MAG: hypothetical protein LBK44_00935 [Spirochaetales bacterium]|nr:hypothetical protein [Spirochaetales bacterium]
MFWHGFSQNSPRRRTPKIPFKIFIIRIWAHFFAPQKNRAFRCKSSDLPMQILWAFRYNPLRSGSS